MIKPFRKESTLWGLLTIAALAMLASCNPTELQPSTNTAQIRYDGTYANRAFVYQDSPAILAGANYGPNINIDVFLDKTFPELITTNNQLKGNCLMQFNYYFMNQSEASKADCIHSYGKKDTLETIVPRPADGTWIYPSGSKEFYQVNALYHIQKSADKFFDKLNFAYKKMHNGSSASTIPKSIPHYLKNSNLWWFKGVATDNSIDFKNDFLTSYATCVEKDTAYFLPAGPQVCFGSDPARPNFHLVQDPSVVYHEMGHAFITIMMNLRNGTNTGDSTTFRSNLHYFGYDEAGSLGEGLADYFSYIVNGRTHIGEWGLGRFAKQSRPLTESDPLHISGINTTPEGRLSYPQYLMYDPNDPNVPFEDVHYAGQIVSHYMVALTESLKTKCTPEPNMSAQETATSYTVMLLAETLSELGDLRAVGLDYPNSSFPYSSPSGPYFNNLDPSSSYTWAHVVNPPTYRRFFQGLAKNLKKYITGQFCSAFTVTDSERLLDDYGLLLFKNYNDNGNSTTNKTYYHSTALPSYYPAKTLTSVTEANRRKSTLVSKSLLSLAEVSAPLNRASYYTIDNAASMQNHLSQLLFKGIAVTLSTGLAGVNYNNDNIKISPGEILAVIPNLYNASNSPMAGVQILANDWDHMDYNSTTGHYQPCVVDTKTTVDQGAIPENSGTCSSTMSTYKKYVKSPSTGLYPTEAAQPVCMVEKNDGVAAKWVSQNEFRQGLAFQPKDCLGFTGNSTNSDEDFSFNPNECLIRILPGAQQAFYSRIDAQKSFIETIRTSQNFNTFNPGNSIVMEVNKWIPPGTKFRCRLRARFSNCSDCFTDTLNTTHPGDDYIDADLNGAKPYKIINLDFTVND